MRSLATRSVDRTDLRTGARPSAIAAPLGLLVCTIASGTSLATDGAAFERSFTGATLRIDAYHSGTADEERFALGRFRIEGDWPGSRTALLDPNDFGKYRIEVEDIATRRVLYTRGFSSLYGEWETTGEARAGTWRTFPETYRVPETRGPAQLRLRKRTADGTFREIWSLRFDPASRFVDRATVLPQDVRTVFEHGPPETRVDLLILGDGYTPADADRFVSDVDRAVEALFAEEPFRSRKSDFNVRAIAPPAAESGITAPRPGRFRESPLGVRSNTFDSQRYVMTLAEHRWRDVAAAAPYDFVLIVFPGRTYGGGGIYGLYSTAAAGSAFYGYLVVHEFGHHFAGLGDEYYTSEVSYEEFNPPDVEPWEPNVTALLDPENLKWGDLVSDDTPLPTPWPKKTYEEAARATQARRLELRSAGADESELEALFREQRERETPLLASGEYAGRVGAFEGAGYEAVGLYRPATDCIMFTRDDVGFCPVCLRAIERVIDLYSR